jgi:hypothetical protein
LARAAGRVAAKVISLARRVAGMIVARVATWVAREARRGGLLTKGWREAWRGSQWATRSLCVTFLKIRSRVLVVWHSGW